MAEKVLILSDGDNDGGIISKSRGTVKKVLYQLAGNREIIDCVVFVTMRPEKAQFHDPIFLHQLRTIGIKLQCFEPTLTNDRNGRMRLKGYPDYLIFEYALRRIHLYDTVIFISSDSDFLNFIEELARYEKRTELATRKNLRRKFSRKLSLPNIRFHSIDAYLQN